MKAIVVSGAPATGKTHIARHLANELRIPLLERDTIKEALFDSLGHSDRSWSKRLGSASFDVLFALAEASFRSGVPSVILEANFSSQGAVTLQAFHEKYKVELIQVFCHASTECLWQRFQERSNSGNRHPGHVDSQNLEEARLRIFSTDQTPIALPGVLIDLETTELDTIDIQRLMDQILGHLNKEPNKTSETIPNGLSQF